MTAIPDVMTGIDTEGSGYDFIVKEALNQRQAIKDQIARLSVPTEVYPEDYGGQYAQYQDRINKYNADFLNYQFLSSQGQQKTMLREAVQAYDWGAGTSTLTPFQKALLISMHDLVGLSENQVEVLQASLEEDVGTQEAQKYANGRVDTSFKDENGNIIQPPNTSNTNPAQPTSGTAQSQGPQYMGNGIWKRGSNWVVFDPSKQSYVPYIPPTDEDFDKKPEEMANVDENDASGQNNHTLAFAKGKEGQIAVTGE